jgi:hypothetical protein
MEQDLINKISKLENDLNSLKSLFYRHQHDGVDGTNTLRKKLILDQDQFLTIGTSQQGTITGGTAGTETYNYILGVGTETQSSGFVNKSPNLQILVQHTPNTTQSFFQGQRSPLVTSVQGTSISTTLGGTTVTIDGFNFSTNELAGALINIINSSGTLIETQTIASNTSTVVTISGTWSATTSNATFVIFIPVYLGSANYPWQRDYVQEGTAGGVRFGVGPTAGGQNGLLYMDTTGDLYWRNKGGASTKLN